MIKYEIHVYTDGSKEWYIDGKLHREDGPAVERANGSKYWYIDGKKHREDGPAIEYADGSKEWYIDGKRLTEAELNSRQKSCAGKVVEIDGVKYRLQEAE